VIVCYVDGLCEPERWEGVATYGVVIRKDDGELVYMGSGMIGEGKGFTNQVSEYYAVIDALKSLIGHYLANEETIIYTDSKLVAEQMNGHWKAVKGAYLPYFLKARDYQTQFSHLKFQWIPREENKEADKMSRLAYESWMLATGRKPRYGKRKPKTMGKRQNV
jgi:ribonuclease HI